MAVLELAQALGIGRGLARVEELGRPQEAPHLVGSKGVSHRGENDNLRGMPTLERVKS